MKRFQELFASPSRPNDVLPSFFDTSKFGQCENLVFCDLVPRMRKVTSVSHGTRLQDLTVNRNVWPSLIAEMDLYQSLCLKSLSLSASSDVIFVSNVSCGSDTKRMTVGITAKNFNKTVAGLSDIENECSKFNAMFESSKRRDRLNLLIFCATNFGSDTIKQFGDKNFFVHASVNHPFIATK
jgi:hypothetical protein